ncbi:MAG: NAD(P)/FAD-dependent oxidoreductase [bacterium]
MSHSQYDVIIIGAGAAGLMCAIEAGKRGRSALLLEKADKVGKKILISGGGRCNFTNLYIEPSAYLSNNPHFCKSALSRYTQWDFIALMDKHEIPWQEKTLGQLFCDLKAGAVVDMLVTECKAQKVRIQTNTTLGNIEHEDHFVVHSSRGTFHTPSLVIATGGPSIPRMGSSDLGIRIARQFGLHSHPFQPALVPFTFSQDDLSGFFKDLSGISLPVVVWCQHQHFRENLLFTHRGLSGPAILQISSYWQKGLALCIDLVPDEDLEDRLLEAKTSTPQKHLPGILSRYLPKKLAQRFCEQRFGDQALAELSDQKIKDIAATLKNWQVTPSGTEGMRTAEVCTGGIDTDELSSKTFESKKVPGLYFIGETVDVTGHLGGYNFQWAWSSGWSAGQFV